MGKHYDFTRGELQNLRIKAQDEANVPHLNELWQRMYLALADAADHLDAAMARTEITVPSEEVKN